MSHSHEKSRTPVTVIGLGRMGRALAEALLRDDHPTTVWNRTAARAEPLVARGAVPAASLRAAVAAGPLVIVCVTDHDAVHALLRSLDEDALAGRTLVNLTSGTSEQARATARLAAERGAGYLDGAIMAVPQAIGTDEALIIYSGSRAVFDEHEPVLRTLGAGTTHLGADHGLAALYDAAGLGLMWSVLNGFLLGAALLGTAGVPASAFASFARENIGTVAGWLAGYAGQIDDGRYPPLDATLDVQLAAMDHLVEESEAVGVDADLPRFFRALGERAVAGGHGDEGYAALIEVFRRGSGAHG